MVKRPEVWIDPGVFTACQAQSIRPRFLNATVMVDTWLIMLVIAASDVSIPVLVFRGEFQPKIVAAAEATVRGGYLAHLASVLGCLVNQEVLS
mgnify:CR=1 FL=1